MVRKMASIALLTDVNRGTSDDVKVESICFSDDDITDTEVGSQVYKEADFRVRFNERN